MDEDEQSKPFSGCFVALGVSLIFLTIAILGSIGLFFDFQKKRKELTRAQIILDEEKHSSFVDRSNLDYVERLSEQRKTLGKKFQARRPSDSTRKKVSALLSKALEKHPSPELRAVKAKIESRLAHPWSAATLEVMEAELTLSSKHPSSKAARTHLVKALDTLLELQ